MHRMQISMGYKNVLIICIENAISMAVGNAWIMWIECYKHKYLKYKNKHKDMLYAWFLWNV